MKKIVLEYITSDSTLYFTNRQWQLIDELVEGGFLIDSMFNELDFIHVESDYRKYRNDLFSLTIAPTLECNYCCEYCYEKRISGVMNQEVMKAILLEIENQVKKNRNINIIWYDGEPLLCLDLILKLTDKIMKLCIEYKVNYTARMVTNGYLLTEEAIDKIRAAEITAVQITVDGPTNIHNKRRKLRGSSQGTFQQTIESLERLQRADISIYTRINIDLYNRDSIEELLNYWLSIT